MIALVLASAPVRAQTPAGPAPSKIEGPSLVKLALDKVSLNLRLDAYAPLMDLAAFTALEGQTALAADEAYILVRNLLPPASP